MLGRSYPEQCRCVLHQLKWCLEKCSFTNFDQTALHLPVYMYITCAQSCDHTSVNITCSCFFKACLLSNYEGTQWVNSARSVVLWLIEVSLIISWCPRSSSFHYSALCSTSILWLWVIQSSRGLKKCMFWIIECSWKRMNRKKSGKCFQCSASGVLLLHRTDHFGKCCIFGLVLATAWVPFPVLYASQHEAFCELAWTLLFCWKGNPQPCWVCARCLS